MNANSYKIDIPVEYGQVEEVVLSLFNTILLHRTTGKFYYRQEGTYSVGTIGTEDIDCEFLDFTYVRVASNELQNMLKKSVISFHEQMQQKMQDGISIGTITLEFFQKHRNRWPFNDESVPWEIWNLHVTERILASETERAVARETAGARLSEKVASIVEAVGRHDFVPKMPTQSDLNLVFDTTLNDVQPYLFQISCSYGNHNYSNINPSNGTTVGSTVKRLFRDTLTL